MNEIVKCKDCKHGHFFVPCKEAKTNHDLLKYQCNKIKRNHNPNFYYYKPFCVHCFKNGKYEEATEVSDDRTPLCKFHYKQYMDNVFAEIYNG